MGGRWGPCSLELPTFGAVGLRLIRRIGADTWLAGPLGVLSFLFSVLSSRTVSAVKEAPRQQPFRGLRSSTEDMDDPGTPLIGRFGHCSQARAALSATAWQELVNLLLIGEATSLPGCVPQGSQGRPPRNVFDGTRWLGDDPSSGFLVRGVESDRVGVPPVGLLSELETYRYLAVGMPLGRWLAVVLGAR